MIMLAHTRMRSERVHVGGGDWNVVPSFVVLVLFGVAIWSFVAQDGSS